MSSDQNNNNSITKNFSPGLIKLLIVLVIVGIIVGAVGNAMTPVFVAEQREIDRQEREEFSKQQSAITRGLIESHANETSQILAYIAQAQIEQQPLLEQFKVHMNQTATGVPIVLQNAEQLKYMEQMIEDILNDTRNDGE
jgi:hypothetical protein